MRGFRVERVENFKPFLVSSKRTVSSLPERVLTVLFLLYNIGGKKKLEERNYARISHREL